MAQAWPSFINGKPVVDMQDVFGEKQMLANTTNNVIVQFRVRPGKRAYVMGLGVAWDIGGDHLVTLHLDPPGHNGDYKNIKVQIAPPENVQVLPGDGVQVEQNQLVTVYGDNADAVNSWYAAARVVVLFTDL